MKQGNMQFHSSSHEQALRTKGFFKISFLSQKEIIALEKLFCSHFEEKNLPLFFDSLTGVKDSKTRREIHNAILEICYPALRKVLGNFFPVIAMFYTKNSGEQSELGMHIDPSMTLKEFNHIGVWIPLSGANQITGKMCFLAGTQNLTSPYHGLSIENPYRKVSEQLKPLMECVEIEPQEAVFFENNLLHYTQKNVSGKLRISVIIKVIDANAPLVNAFLNKNVTPPEIEFYESPNDYYISDYFQQEAYPRNSKKLNFTLPAPVSFSDSDIEKFKAHFNGSEYSVCSEPI